MPFDVLEVQDPRLGVLCEDGVEAGEERVVLGVDGVVQGLVNALALREVPEALLAVPVRDVVGARYVNYAWRKALSTT